MILPKSYFEVGLKLPLLSMFKNVVISLISLSSSYALIQ